MAGSTYGLMLWLWIILAPAVAFVLMTGNLRTRRQDALGTHPGTQTPAQTPLTDPVREHRGSATSASAAAPPGPRSAPPV